MQRPLWRHLSLLTLALAVSDPALAAEATDVLDAIDGDDYFDANIEMHVIGHGKTAKISREDVRGGQQADVVEFQYAETSLTVMPRLRIGIFQDIELFIGLPYTVADVRGGWNHYRNPANQDPASKGYSTFLRDACTFGSSSQDPVRPKACAGYPDEGRSTLSGEAGSWPVNHNLQFGEGSRPSPGSWHGRDTDWDFQWGNSDPYTPQFYSVRGAVAYNVENGFYLFPKGLGDAHLGFAFSPFSIARFNDQRESAMPTMRVEFYYQVPSGPLETPGPRRSTREALGGTATNFDPGGTGSGLHRLNAGLAMSKRLKMFDPFLKVGYQLGIPQYYGRDAPERQWNDFNFWTHQAHGLFGVELVPFYYLPDVEEVVDLRFILAGFGNYVSAHRGPSEMSDVLNKWTYVQDYFQLFGQLGMVLAVPFVKFRALLEVGHESPHLITGEPRATNRDILSPSKSEVNPFYNPILDAPGRRVKVSETIVVNGSLMLAITF